MAKYCEESVEKITSLIEDDFCSVAEICRVMGISRKTFYSWKDTKPELAREIEKAESRREERTRQMLYSSLKKRLDGYIMVEEKETYLPDANSPDGVSLQSKTIRRKNCLPDLRTIKLLLDRQDKKSPSKPLQGEVMIPKDTPVIVDEISPDDEEKDIITHDEEIEMEELFEQIDKALTTRQKIRRKLTATNNCKPVYQQGKRKRKRRK